MTGQDAAKPACTFCEGTDDVRLIDVLYEEEDGADGWGMKDAVLSWGVVAVFILSVIGAVLAVAWHISTFYRGWCL